MNETQMLLGEKRLEEAARLLEDAVDWTASVSKKQDKYIKRDENDGSPRLTLGDATPEEFLLDIISMLYGMNGALVRIHAVIAALLVEVSPKREKGQ